MTTRTLPASKAGKITYWIATVWLALGMLSTAIVQIIKMDEEVNMMTHLGYPIYFLNHNRCLENFGRIGILVPKFPIIKEWAYAGFCFVMTGAVIFSLSPGDSAKDLFGPILLLILTGVSWYFRPANRKIVSVNP
jgi:hypothetical protein